jgi:hypothetical protein
LVEVRPGARQNVRVNVDLHSEEETPNTQRRKKDGASCPTSNIEIRKVRTLILIPAPSRDRVLTAISSALAFRV